jgi:N-acetylglucosaminyldiphosphoundecaprenol N-acetyl-beta-D-mannosaminyltransferase
VWASFEGASMTGSTPHGAHTDAARVPLRFIGLGVTPLSAEEVADRVTASVSAGATLALANLNLHGAYMAYTDQAFAQYTEEADYCLCDGWPIVKLVADRRFRSSVYRVGSTDWLDVLLEQDRGEINYVSVGGTPESARKAEENLTSEHPLLRWKAFPGYGVDRAHDDPRLTAAIAEADVVLVGMGMPTQENWILQHRDLLQGKVVANVGGCLDYYAKTQPLAPRWLGAIGLEWAYRLLQAPDRLAHRYLVEPFLLAGHVLRAKRGKST